MLTTIAAALIAYLIGSIPFAVIVSRAMGLPDPRTFGSKNPGATNMLRSGRKIAAALTLLGDMFKGWFAVYLAQRFAPTAPFEYAVAIAALAVVLGHMFSWLLHFEGGKGVATAFGVLYALDTRLALVVIVVWLLTAAAFRFSSLASIVAAVAAAVSALALHHDGPLFFWSVPVIAALVIWRHRDNIRKLLAGSESRIGGNQA